MQRNYFKKHKQKISLEGALEEFYELIEWCKTEGREFREKYPLEHERITKKILEDRKRNPNYRN